MRVSGGVLAVIPAHAITEDELLSWGVTFGAKAGESVVIVTDGLDGEYDVEGRFCDPDRLCEIRVRLHRHEGGDSG